MPKIPVNSPCPCGSGRKYKKCCRDRQAANPAPTLREIAEVTAKFDAYRRKESEHQRRFGQVRPFVHADFKGHKIVAIGSQIFASPHVRTVPDFLSHHLASLFGPRTWAEECEAPIEKAHPLVRLARITYDRIARGEAQDGLVAPEVDGTVFEFAAACYDLYVLRHNGAYQRSLLERLRRADNYRGARYELFVAATFVRAGFDLTWINERKAANAAPEFIATHRVTGTRVAVEAKSRHREAIAPSLEDVNVTRLLADALSKRVEDPLIVFLDPNISRAVVPQTKAAWLELVERELGRIPQAHDADGRAMYAAAVFTNYCHEDGLPVAFQSLLQVPKDPVRPIPLAVVQAISVALDQFGNLPTSFED